METLWGIDLGGTKMEGVVVDSRDMTRVLARRRLPTGKELGYDHILNQIQQLVEILSAETGLRPERLGMGTPGTEDPATQLHKNSNTTSLNGRPFRKDISRRLGIPVEVANDANCFALAETLWGAVHQAAPQARVAFGVIMGTGVGGGLVVDGRVINGRHGIAGEWGHNFLDASGGMCYCGRVGCVETLISGPALERYYHSLTGNARSLPEILTLPDDPAANQTIERLLHFFGKAMAPLINILDPDAIVLGGGLGNIDLLYTRGVEEVAKYLFNPVLETPFLKPLLGDSAGVFGAALLARKL